MHTQIISEKRPDIQKKTPPSTTYERFTPLMALEISAPHTWPASILPVLVAFSCACASTQETISIVLTCILLAICIFMQGSVNTFNDYYDFVKGADSLSDDVDPSDAVLVYNNVNPRTALIWAIAQLAIAFFLGIYVIYLVGWIPLFIALIGAFCVVFYSAGKTPVSYLPIGELVSGTVMGGLIPLACYQALTEAFSWLALLWAIPTIIGVGLIMMTNNTCDIEKDREASRHTLPALLGRTHARHLYHALVVLWVLAIIALVGFFFADGLVVTVFMLLATIPLLVALFKNPLAPTTRIGAMAQICSVNIALSAFYAAGILASAGAHLAVF